MMNFKVPSRLRRLLVDSVELQQLKFPMTQPLSQPSRRRVSARPAPQGLTEVLWFGRNPGDLRMLEYVPPGAKGPMPLVVILHGCHQNAEDFDRASGWTALAREHGFAVLYAEQKISNNLNLCFNWFRPSSVTRDRGELGSIREMIDFSRRLHNIDDSKIFVMGLSAGGALSAALLATYPELFAAGAIIGGLPFGAARDAMSALDVMKRGSTRTAEKWGALVREVSPEAARYPAVSIWHGDGDEVVSFANAEASVAQWLAAHERPRTKGRLRLFDGGERREWRDEYGSMILELVTLNDFGHGLPVGSAIEGREPANDTERFILPAALSAPEELVKSWKLST
ncbi:MULTISPECIES: alpha/beta hydrolase family esterase [unclassified Rhizobium]|uniref:extracellular catalytic domain type 1 short-chain-length polyhydroxyalkanoate depolymerase n=1 Tax=unclassified Rhizobium TaxID=2613769 RepID=UPI001FED855E|nr:MULTISPECIES: PHB depolymerase family esterase [unclassified Rhizobium]